MNTFSMLDMHKATVSHTVVHGVFSFCWAAYKFTMYICYLFLHSVYNKKIKIKDILQELDFCSTTGARIQRIQKEHFPVALRILLHKIILELLVQFLFIIIKSPLTLNHTLNFKTQHFSSRKAAI